jgi:hydrogenase/urease accessory protein HupE
MNHRRSRFTPIAPALLVSLACLWPAPAHAHTSIQGMGEFISGLAHPVTTPAHILILIGMGLFAGQNWMKNFKIPLVTFVAVAAFALAMTLAGPPKFVTLPVLITIALGVGALVALDKPIPIAASTGLFAIAALAIGLDSGVETGGSAVVFKTLAGTWIAMVVLVINTGFYLSLGLQKKWLKIGVRIIGSWLVAISLMVLAFALKK